MNPQPISIESQIGQDLLSYCSEFGLTETDLQSALKQLNYLASRYKYRVEVLQSACIGLLEAVPCFDKRRGVTLGTYSSNYMRGEIRRSQENGTVFISLDDEDLPEEYLVSQYVNPRDSAVSVEKVECVKSFVESLPDNLANLVKMLFWEDYTQAGAARPLGISRQMISKMMIDVRRRGRRFIRRNHLEDLY